MGRSTVAASTAVLTVALVVLGGATVGGAVDDGAGPVASGADAGVVGDLPPSPVATPELPDAARLTVTGVTVEPSTPVVGEPVTLSVALRNSGGSPSAVQVDEVAVYRANGSDASGTPEDLTDATATGDRLASATDLGTLSAADALTVPLTARFASAGVHRLVVVANGTNESGNYTEVRRPVTVVVERSPPQIDAPAVSAVTGGAASVEVQVSNPTTDPIRNVAVRISGGAAVSAGTGTSDAAGPSDGADRPVIVDDRRSIPRLAGGATTTVQFPVRAGAPGSYRLNVSLSYTTSTGVTATANGSARVVVRPAERDVGVRVAPVRQDQSAGGVGSVQGILGGGRTTESDEESGVPTRVEVTVTNFGTAPATGVVVTGQAGDTDLARRSVATRLSPGESASVVVDLSRYEAGTVRFDATATVAGGNVSAATTYEYRPAAGRVRLTGLALSFGPDGDLQIEGNAGNVGDAAVEGVVLSVGNGTYVDPAYPSRTYFVGTVEASEFAPFELTADVDAANVSTIPVTVEYAVDGESVERTVQVPYDPSLEPPEDDPSGSGIELYLGAGVAILVVAGVALLVYRRRSEE